MTRIPLPEPDLLPDIDVNFLELIETRQSAAEFEDGSITLQELSYLLWCTQGVKMVLPDGRTLRNVPATCGVHALETVLLVCRVDDLERGIYRFLPLEHALEYYPEDVGLPMEIERILWDECNASHGCVTFLWMANIALAKASYGETARQGVYVDAGYACQNLYLTARALDCRIQKHDQFDRDAISDLLGLDGDTGAIIHAATVGR